MKEIDEGNGGTMSKSDRLWMTIITVGGFGFLWFFDISSWKPGNETGGFMLIFFTPILLVATIGTLYQVGRTWFEKI
jgi:hypothetical protein